MSATPPRRGGERVRVLAGDHHLKPALVQELGRGEADTARSAGDQGCGWSLTAPFDRQAALLLDPAAFNAGAFDLLREGGRLGYLPRMLTVLGIVSARLADWNTAIPAAAEEARRLAAEIGAPQWAGGAMSSTA